MKKSILSTLTKILAVIFVAAEAMLFYMIHLSKAASPISLRYLSIQIAALFSILFFALKSAKRENSDKRPRGILIMLAMLSTLAADYFLVAIPEMKRMEGMICFSATQLFIFLHLFFGEENKVKRKAHLIVRAAATVMMALTTLLVLGKSADALAIISVIYYANLLTSMVFAPMTKSGGTLLFIGLILFALCDINVGLTVLSDLYGGDFPEGSLIHSILYSGVDLAWLFYLPSQTLIPLTILRKEKA